MNAEQRFELYGKDNSMQKNTENSRKREMKWMISITNSTYNDETVFRFRLLLSPTRIQSRQRTTKICFVSVRIHIFDRFFSLFSLFWGVFFDIPLKSASRILHRSRFFSPAASSWFFISHGNIFSAFVINSIAIQSDRTK